jgi:ABC-type phosphate transport system substrate-binding protein
MTSLVVRRLASACALSAAAAVALVAPGIANASTLGVQCSGANITGRGSSLQKIAQQEIWGPGFNTSANSKACNETQGSKGKPTVTYESTGSGAGMEAWGLNAHAFEAEKVAFVGTDAPPNTAQREEIQSHSSKPLVNTLQTIPVLQTAVSVPIDLPAHCSATSTSTPGRLVLDNVTLEKIWRGVITKWSEITENGDKLLNKEKLICNANAEITRIVRFDESGTTAIFKKYLGLINKEKNIIGEKGWTELATGKPFNQEWPGTVVRPAEKGGQALVTKVAATESSIGYADLADVRHNGSFSPTSGGGGKQRFWAKLQNNGLSQEGETYADPSSNGDSATLGNANCSSTEYTNGEVPFPPASTLELWNEVTTKTAEPHYPICGLTYDLTFTEYSKYPGTTLNQATSVNNYITFVLNGAAGGGAALIKNHDYLGLPTSLMSIAAKGAAKTRF